MCEKANQLFREWIILHSSFKTYLIVISHQETGIISHVFHLTDLVLVSGTEISHQCMHTMFIVFAEVGVLWLTGAMKGCSLMSFLLPSVINSPAISSSLMALFMCVSLNSIAVKNGIIVGCMQKKYPWWNSNHIFFTFVVEVTTFSGERGFS